jgi:hypothetical protein
MLGANLGTTAQLKIVIGASSKAVRNLSNKAHITSNCKVMGNVMLMLRFEQASGVYERTNGLLSVLVEVAFT